MKTDYLKLLEYFPNLYYLIAFRGVTKFTKNY